MARKTPDTSKTPRIYSGRALRDQVRQKNVRSRKSLRSQKQRQQKQAKQAKAVKKVLISLVLILFAIFLISRLFIYDHYVNRDDIYDEQLSSMTEEYLSSGLRRLKLLFSASDYQNYILENDASVVGIETFLPLFSTTLAVETISRSPSVVWLDDRRALYYSVDAFGVAYDNQLTLAPGQPLIKDISGISVSIGDSVISPANIDFINEFFRRASNNELEIDSFTVTENPRDVNVFLVGDDYFIKLTTTRSAQDQINDLKQALKFVKNNNKIVNSYIDVRVADKVFYK